MAAITKETALQRCAAMTGPARRVRTSGNLFQFRPPGYGRLVRGRGVAKAKSGGRIPSAPGRPAVVGWPGRGGEAVAAWICAHAGAGYRRAVHRETGERVWLQKLSAAARRNSARPTASTHPPSGGSMAAALNLESRTAEQIAARPGCLRRPARRRCGCEHCRAGESWTCAAMHNSPPSFAEDRRRAPPFTPVPDSRAGRDLC